MTLCVTASCRRRGLGQTLFKVRAGSLLLNTLIFVWGTHSNASNAWLRVHHAARQIRQRTRYRLLPPLEIQHNLVPRRILRNKWSFRGRLSYEALHTADSASAYSNTLSGRGRSARQRNTSARFRHGNCYFCVLPLYIFLNFACMRS